MSKPWGRLFKFLWPSQESWTLKGIVNKDYHSIKAFAIKVQNHPVLKSYKLGNIIYIFFKNIRVSTFRHISFFQYVSFSTYFEMYCNWILARGNRKNFYFCSVSQLQSNTVPMANEAAGLWATMDGPIKYCRYIISCRR